MYTRCSTYQDVDDITANENSAIEMFLLGLLPAAACTISQNEKWLVTGELW
jgi:hypothetical protein